jgi:hypothetical protein
MRKAKRGGTCADCGATSTEGLYWINLVKVLDCGVEGMAPVEPDTRAPERCDDCEYLYRMRPDFEADPDQARVICGRDLRLIGE